MEENLFLYDAFADIHDLARIRCNSRRRSNVEDTAINQQVEQGVRKAGFVALVEVGSIRTVEVGQRRIILKMDRMSSRRGSKPIPIAVSGKLLLVECQMLISRRHSNEDHHSATLLNLLNHAVDLSEALKPRLGGDYCGEFK